MRLLQRKYAIAIGLLTLTTAWSSIYGQTGVTIATAQYDNARTAANLHETILKPSNTNASSFGKLYSFPVDGYVLAQPLYVHGLISGGRAVNVLYVATMHNSIYAFDADNHDNPPLFKVSLGASVPAGWAGKCPAPTGGVTGPELGIFSTPVIDVASRTLYAISATPDAGPAGSGTYVHRLFALDILTGQTKLASPVVISASVPGTGIDSVNGQVSMNKTRHIQRTGLLLANGTVYAGFGSCGPDPDPYHGWLVGYNAKTLQQAAVFNSSPNGKRNAIWQAGRGLVSDLTGSIYAFTGNGTWDGASNFSESVVKVSPSGTLVDWFTPTDYAVLDSNDLDLSASGPLLMPDSNLIVGGGKQGVLYVLNPFSLGKLGNPRQQFQATPLCAPVTYSGCYQIHSLAYWQSARTLYIWGVKDRLVAYKATHGRFKTTPNSQSSMTASYPGGALALSAHKGSGIVWAVTPDSVLHAFDATNVATELWNSAMNPTRDRMGTYSKFVSPVVADGKVFVSTLSGAVVAYGLLP